MRLRSLRAKFNRGVRKVCKVSEPGSANSGGCKVCGPIRGLRKSVVGPQPPVQRGWERRQRSIRKIFGERASPRTGRPARRKERVELWGGLAKTGHPCERKRSGLRGQKGIKNFSQTSASGVARSHKRVRAGGRCAHAAGLLLAIFASSRFPDAQRLGSTRGTLADASRGGARGTHINGNTKAGREDPRA